MIVFVIMVVSALWFGFRVGLDTDYPALAVASGSMCKVQHMSCDGWSHPFDQTLHTGDLIIVQGVNASDIHAAPYPDGDIIVFHQLYGNELIVHRAIDKTVDENGRISFETKGDGNSSPDPNKVPADQVVGKVVLRIPWIGHLALFTRNSQGVYIIIALIVIIIIIELAIPLLKTEKPEKKQEENVQKPPNNSSSDQPS
jgi:signal peptidase I